MDILRVKKINEAYIKVYCEPGIAGELNDYFTFEVPGAKFMPAYRNKVWDGKVRLYNQMTQSIYTGLLPYVERFARERKYEVEYESDFTDSEFSLFEAEEFIRSLDLPITPRDYQVKAFNHAVRNRRAILLSPTGSGKSLIIYLLVRYYERYFEDNPDAGSGNILIIVPTTSLVSQLATDFSDYGYDSDNRVHRIFSGQEKKVLRPVTISTWQSIYKLPKSYFGSFSVVIGDEAHLFKAKSLTDIMTKMENCVLRFGFTGTLDGTQTNRLVLEGLFGAAKKVTTTSDLIEQKHLADFSIKALVLKYPEDTCKLIKSFDYKDEIDWIVTCKERNVFIRNLTLSLKGNTLLLFQFVEKHGKILHEMISGKAGSRRIFFVHGGVDGDEREEIRRIVEKEADAIIVASYGTFSTGINIRNLHNIVFASPSKSRVRNLQSIGRGLRVSENKQSSRLYDIADDFSYKTFRNHTLLHFVERMKIYNEEKFPYKIYKIDLKV
jgi:superfamily II DNA or RNA helicase